MGLRTSPGPSPCRLSDLTYFAVGVEDHHFRQLGVQQIGVSFFIAEHLEDEAEEDVIVFASGPPLFLEGYRFYVSVGGGGIHHVQGSFDLFLFPGQGRRRERKRQPESQNEYAEQCASPEHGGGHLFRKQCLSFPGNIPSIEERYG